MTTLNLKSPEVTALAQRVIKLLQEKPIPSNAGTLTTIVWMSRNLTKEDGDLLENLEKDLGTLAFEWFTLILLSVNDDNKN